MAQPRIERVLCYKLLADIWIYRGCAPRAAEPSSVLMLATVSNHVQSAPSFTITSLFCLVGAAAQMTISNCQSYNFNFCTA